MIDPDYQQEEPVGLASADQKTTEPAATRLRHLHDLIADEFPAIAAMIAPILQQISNDDTREFIEGRAISYLNRTNHYIGSHCVYRGDRFNFDEYGEGYMDGIDRVLTEMGK